MIAATEQPASRLCTACFDGNYPIELPGETALGKNVIEQMLATAARTGIPMQADNDNVSALRRPSVAVGRTRHGASNTNLPITSRFANRCTCPRQVVERHALGDCAAQACRGQQVSGERGVDRRRGRRREVPARRTRRPGRCW